MSVKRYCPTGCEVGCDVYCTPVGMAENAEGGYVLATDYDALAADLARISTELGLPPGIGPAVIARMDADLRHQLQVVGPESRAREHQARVDMRAATARAEAAESDLLKVADALGYVNRAEGSGGYEIAPIDTLVEAVRRLQWKDEAGALNEAMGRAEAAEAKLAEVTGLLGRIVGHLETEARAGDGISDDANFDYVMALAILNRKPTP